MHFELNGFQLYSFQYSWYYLCNDVVCAEDFRNVQLITSANGIWLAQYNT
jgi:hypothetical protein